ncbi:chitinase-3-like protein 1 isoform X1 [Ixodes scapularis]|uniref:chitinase-3-like protein 1 isoform X1 n=1 Tax=Ixodes scapularis TaxID=6945 RepID=UPI001C386609|nr:chitinase-3-like protein 1 isoform X1 [Ixodes scapularis]
MKWLTLLALMTHCCVALSGKLRAVRHAEFAPPLTTPALVLLTETSENKKVICYWNSWSFYRKGHGKSTPQQLDIAPCTHMVYNTAIIDGSKVVVADPWNDLAVNGGNGNLKQFANLVKKKEGLKVLAAVIQKHGFAFSTAAGFEDERKTFVKSALKFCKSHKLNGLVLSWNDPGAQDKENFVQLLKEMKEAFDKADLSLGAQLSVIKAVMTDGYNLAEISKYVDFMTATTFDYWGPWSGKTGPVAPLYGVSDDYKTPSVAESVKTLLDLGADSTKLVLGITTLARSWTLEDPQDTDFGSSSRQPGKPGPYTQTPGALGYNEVCEFMRAKKWTVNYNTDLKESYATDNKSWVSFEDAESVKEKAVFAKSKNLGGVAIMSLDTDDISGKCGEPYPLLRAASKEFMSQ